MDSSISYIDGVQNYGIFSRPTIEFVECSKYQNVSNTTSECMSKTELDKWKEENEELFVSIVYSFNFVDFEDPDEPTRLSASGTLPIPILHGTV